MGSLWFLLAIDMGCLAAWLVAVTAEWWFRAWYVTYMASGAAWLFALAFLCSWRVADMNSALALGCSFVFLRYLFRIDGPRKKLLS